MLLVLCRDCSIFQKYLMFVCLSTSLPLPPPPLPSHTSASRSSKTISLQKRTQDFSIRIPFASVLGIFFLLQTTNFWHSVLNEQKLREKVSFYACERKTTHQHCLLLPLGFTSRSGLVVWLCWSQLHHIKLNACHHFNVCQGRHFGNGWHQFS